MPGWEELFLAIFGDNMSQLLRLSDASLFLSDGILCFELSLVSFSRSEASLSISCDIFRSYLLLSHVLVCFPNFPSECKTVFSSSKLHSSFFFLLSPLFFNFHSSCWVFFHTHWLCMCMPVCGLHFLIHSWAWQVYAIYPCLLFVQTGRQEKLEFSPLIQVPFLRIVCWRFIVSNIERQLQPQLRNIFS